MPRARRSAEARRALGARDELGVQVAIASLCRDLTDEEVAAALAAAHVDALPDDPPDLASHCARFRPAP